MIKLSRLDGTPIYINEKNIQWVESLPDTAITFLGGARIVVLEKVSELLEAIRKEVIEEQKAFVSKKD